MSIHHFTELSKAKSDLLNCLELLPEETPTLSYSKAFKKTSDLDDQLTSLSDIARSIHDSLPPYQTILTNARHHYQELSSDVPDRTFRLFDCGLDRLEKEQLEKHLDLFLTLIQNTNALFLQVQGRTSKWLHAAISVRRHLHQLLQAEWK